MTSGIATPVATDGAAPDQTDQRRTRCGALFDEHYAALVRFACSLAYCDRADAEDVVQDTFLCLYRTRGELLDGTDAEATLVVRRYLYGSVEGRVRGRFRDSRVRARYEDAAGRAAHSATPRTPEQLVGDQDLAARYRAALARLSDQQRAMLLLVHEHGCTGAEAARRLGISTGAAKQHLKRALQRLQQDLRQELTV